MVINIEAIVVQQLETAAHERRAAKDERKSLRDEHLHELEAKANTQFEASTEQIDVNVSKAWANAVGAPFGAFGTIGSSVANIVLDETEGRHVADLERDTVLTERRAASLQHDLDDQKSTEEARAQEAKQSYDAGVEVLDKRADLCRIA